MAIDYETIIAEDEVRRDALETAVHNSGQNDNGPEWERACSYVDSIPGVSDGERHNKLNWLAYHSMEIFPSLSETQHRELCMGYNSRCAPPLSETDAKRTIKGGWEGCHRNGKVGSKSVPPAHEERHQKPQEQQKNAQGWEPPIPLDDYELPEFPADALPLWLGSFVEAEAEATQTPVDLAAMSSLAVLATALAKTALVEVKTDWHEPLNIFTMTMLPPGNRKSAVFRDVTAPLEAWAQEEASRLSPVITENSERLDILQRKKDHLRKKAASSKDDDELEQLTREISELTHEIAELSVPVVPRLIADDCTPERLNTLLSQHGGRMAVLSSEGTIIQNVAGRYSSSGSPHLEVLLKGHAGDTIRIDRVNRPTEFIPEPAVTLGLCVQPDVIQSLRDKPEFRGRGLLGRILYSMPRSPLGYRDANPQAVSEEIRREYHEQVSVLLNMQTDTPTDGQFEPQVLTLTPEAQKSISDFQERLEPSLAQGAEYSHMVDWASKLGGAVVRIAGLLHVVNHAGIAEMSIDPITEDTMKCAIRIGEYLIPHAQAAYAAMNADPIVEKARRILQWLRRENKQSFTGRDVLRGVRGLIAKDRDAALSLLEDHSFIRSTQKQQGRAGRPQSQGFQVNPLWNSDGQHA